MSRDLRIICDEVFGRSWPFDLPTGQLIGTAVLGACRRTEECWDDITAEDRAAGDFSIGRFAWRLDEPQLLRTPIVMSGRQGWWNIAAEELAG